MDVGVPMPNIFLRGDDHDELYVGYVISQPSVGACAEQYAVVRFDGVLQHTFGYPNDEAFGGHPLHEVGLQPYAFNEVIASPSLVELGARNAKAFPGTENRYASLRHWVVSFHDETLEVIGSSVSFLGVVGAASATEAISSYVTAAIASEALQADRDFVDMLGPERSDLLCSKLGCSRGAIALSIFCKRHHFEQVQGRPYQFAD